ERWSLLVASHLVGSVVHGRRRSNGGAAVEAVFGGLAVVVDGRRRAGERGPVIEAIGVDDRAGARRGLADRAEIDRAAPADQEFGGARAKAVGFDERPVLGLDLDRPPRVAR